MTLANSYEDPAREIRQGALSTADGDTIRAFFLLSIKTAELLDGTNVLQGDLKACNRAVQRYQDYYGEDKSWLRKTYDSDIAKVGIFIGGIWLGTQIVQNVN